MSGHWATVETRHGRFHVASRDGKVITIKLPGTQVTELWQTLARLAPGDEPVAATDGVLQDAAIQIQEYCDGLRHELTFPVQLNGTDFQKQVWGALMDVPYGETRSYADIAAAIGKPAAARAVGGANRANHLPLIIPCHRVIAADGGLGGYMGQWGEGGGMALKERFLAIERGQLLA